MIIRLLRGLLWLIVILNSAYALANPDRFLGPRDSRGIKATIDGYVKHNESIFRYGNWYGPGWWGGSTDVKPGNKAPVDSLDIIAQRHDFAYQVAEQQGKVYGIAEEKRLKSIADYFAVRDAKALPENPKQWRYPPADPNKASRYRDRMVTGFSYEATVYEGISIAGKGLDWATSPIENWELDKSHQLSAADLEKQVNSLQNHWNSKNLPPAITPKKPEQLKTSEKTAADKNSTESDKIDPNNAAPVTVQTNPEQQKSKR